MVYPPYGREIHEVIVSSHDPVRYASLALALHTIDSEGIHGHLAEAGVWRGETSKLIHRVCPHRKLFLFDTFEGFEKQDLENEDGRFRDTSIALVEKTIGDLENVRIRPGHFPDTAKDLQDERFAFVILDMDLYKSTLAGLEFFYPRVPSGGYIFLHDYNSPESSWGVSRAVKDFMSEKVEKIVEIPDRWGSVVIRKAG